MTDAAETRAREIMESARYQTPLGLNVPGAHGLGTPVAFGYESLQTAIAAALREAGDESYRAGQYEAEKRIEIHQTLSTPPAAEKPAFSFSADPRPGECGYCGGPLGASFKSHDQERFHRDLEDCIRYLRVR